MNERETEVRKFLGANIKKFRSRTAMVFDQSQVQSYPEIIRNAVHLTHDCSAQYLSKELIQISSEGNFAVYV